MALTGEHPSAPGADGAPGVDRADRAERSLPALRFVRGSWTLLGLRLAVLLLSSLPTLIVAFAEGARLGRTPYFTDVVGRLPMAHLLRLFGSLSPMLLPAIAISVLLFVLADQIVTAGAIAWLARPEADDRAGDGAPADAAAGPSPGVIRAVAEHGPCHLLPLLRLLLLAIVVTTIGALAMSAVFSALERHGDPAGWSGRTLVLVLPLSKALLTSLWLALIGTWVYWCRLLTVVDRRRRLRRTALLALQLLWRQPLRALLCWTGVLLLIAAASAAILFGWRQQGPLSPGGAFWLWPLAWMFALGLKCYAWHALLRAGVLLWRSPRVAELQRGEDAPLGVGEALGRALRRFRPGPPGP